MLFGRRFSGLLTSSSGLKYYCIIIRREDSTPGTVIRYADGKEISFCEQPGNA